MYDENQIVEIKWNCSNKKYFTSIGYSFTKFGDVFTIKAKELSKGSHTKVRVTCDYCNKEYDVPYYSFVCSRKKSSKDSCKECGRKKSLELSLEKRANKSYKKALEFCVSRNYELITNISEYKNMYSTARYRCPTHGIIESNFNMLCKGFGCQKCGYIKLGESKTLNPNIVKEIIDGVNGATLLNQEDYISAQQNIMM